MTPTELTTIRKRAGLSQSGLAALLRLSDQRTIRHWETDTRAISGPASILLEMLDAGELPERYL
jgi:DNA-binding transcriptional regulator YiaG